MTDPTHDADPGEIEIDDDEDEFDDDSTDDVTAAVDNADGSDENGGD